MSLDAALAIAGSGLAAVNKQLALVSHNVANASTAGYAVEVAPQTSMSAAGQQMGVVVGVAQRQIDLELNASLSAQGGRVAGLQVTTSALSAVDTALGTPGQGDDLSSLQGRLQSAFTTLASDPSNQTAQLQVVSAAAGLAGGINGLSTTYQAGRQAAQDALVSQVGQLNSGLQTVGDLSNQIIAVKAAGGSTADLENQRDLATRQVSQLLDVSFLPQANGDMLAFTQSGLTIPLHAPAPPFATSDATIGASSSYPGGIPAITLGGTDVTPEMQGGQIGANLQLRDATLPTFQAELDEYSHTLAARFEGQGLTLFTNAAGVVPAGGTPAQNGYVGFAGSIQVNPAVLANAAKVRDGTNAILAGDPGGGAPFTPNPATGPAGFTTLVTRVLDYTFGANAQPGVPQPPATQTGLGPNGNLAAPYVGDTLGNLVSAMVSSQSQASSDAQDRLTTEQSVETTLQGKVSDVSGVSIDTEMSTMIQLQNAYSANARVVAAVRSMWQTLESTVQ
jgi:flagellar hook-associated protein 1